MQVLYDTVAKQTKCTLQQFKSKNIESAKLLSDLGFKSGNESKEYSDADVTSITSLSAVLQNSNSGKIEKKIKLILKLLVVLVKLKLKVIILY